MEKKIRRKYIYAKAMALVPITSIIVLFFNLSLSAGRLNTSTSTSYRVLKVETEDVDEPTAISMLGETIALRWKGGTGGTQNISANLYLNFLRFFLQSKEQSLLTRTFQLRPNFNIALQGRSYHLMGGYNRFDTLELSSTEAKKRELFLTTNTSYVNLGLDIPKLPRFTVLYTRQDRTSSPTLSLIENSTTSLTLGATYQLGPVGFYLNRKVTSFEDYKKGPSYSKTNYYTLGRVDLSLKPLKPMRISAKYQIEDNRAKEPLESAKSSLSQSWGLDLSFTPIKDTALTISHSAKKITGGLDFPSSMDTSNTISFEFPVLPSLTAAVGHQLTDSQKERAEEKISTATTYLSLYAIPLETIHSYLTLSRADTPEKPGVGKSRINTGSLKMVTRPFDNMGLSFNYTMSDDFSSEKNLLTTSQGIGLQMRVTDNLELDLGYSLGQTQDRSAATILTKNGTTSKALLTWRLTPRLRLTGKYESSQEMKSPDISTDNSFSIDLGWSRRKFYHFNLRYAKHNETGTDSSSGSVSKENVTAQMRLSLSQTTNLVLDYRMENENNTHRQHLTINWTVNF